MRSETKHRILHWLICAAFLLPLGLMIAYVIARGYVRDHIHEAAAKGEVERVKRMLLCPDALEVKDANAATPLHKAAGRGQRDVVELLLSQGADVNARDSADWTPLHFAVASGQTDVVKLLLAKRADVDLQALVSVTYDDGSFSGGHMTTHDLAVQYGHHDLLKILKRHRAERSDE